MKLLLSTRKHDPQEIEELALAMGFDGIEFFMPARSSEDISGWRNSIMELKTVKAIHAPNGIYGYHEFNSALCDSLSTVIEMGVPILNIHPPSVHENFHGRKNVEESLNLMIELSKQYPTLTICCEVLGLPTKPHHFIQRSHQGPAEWLKDIKTYGLFATLDTTHIVSWGEDPAWYVHQLGDQLRHVHISDFANSEQHLFPGEGEIVWDGFFEALKEQSRPDLHLTIEPAGKFDLTAKKERRRLEKSLTFVRHHLGL